ncbi:beta-N-acetylglucosaminidase domain-containing protein [Streptomyces sp. NPDC059637]|uniref:beta-N-acetylglucosaminidase domain-containing protein n=1 Tax=Streptomyces sp. NPDC059637 TaxID=3347752 RepID=UPI0036804BDA
MSQSEEMYVQSRRSRPRAAGAAALVAAVIGSVFGAPSGAAAAPVGTRSASTVPDPVSTGARDASDPSGPEEGAGGVEEGNSPSTARVWPRPQSAQRRGGEVTVTPRVTVVAAREADRHSLEALREVLRSAGAAEVSTVGPNGAVPDDGLLVYAGGARADAVLAALDAPERGDLPSGGYLLAAGRTAGRDVVAMQGVGGDGLFHAVQTLRQTVGDTGGGRGFPGVVVRDWPSAPVRGLVEGFYGEPWTHRERLEQLDFMGRTKQNLYLYASGDDPYRQARWRDPYPAPELERMRELARRAGANHVTLAWAVSPGQSLCFSSPEDSEALRRKVDQLWDAGVRAFQLQFQDVSYTEWHCGDDSHAYGSGPQAAARAQAQVANALSAHLRAEHPSAPPLSLMPTEYYQAGATKYRTALAENLDGRVQVAWTGVGVVPERITGTQLSKAREAFGHPLLTMDNYPVNDYAEDRLFLGPYTGRDPAVAAASAGLLANAMQQPAASRIALFTVADYAWNPRAYRPDASWEAAVADLAAGSGAAREALEVLASHQASSALGTAESSYLRPLLKEFWAARGGSDDRRFERAAGRLRGAFTTMRSAPGRLGRVAGGALESEARPWLAQLSRYGRAGEAAVDMLAAQRRGDGAGGWQAQLVLQKTAAAISASSATVGDGVLDPFLDRAAREADGWTGVRPDGRTATSTMGSARASSPALMLDGRGSTFYWTDSPPEEGDSFGVDLGSVQRVGRVRVEMGSGDGSAADDDYLRHGVLEYSATGSDWKRAGTFHGRRTVVFSLPEGAQARHLRVRALSTQPNAVAVRSFAVTAAESARSSGRVAAPPAAAGSSPAAATDGDPETAYRAATRAAGALSVEFGAVRPLDKVTVLSGPGPHSSASVQVRTEDGAWRRLGGLGQGWTELAAGGVRADAMRLVWAQGAEPPAVHEMVPWFADAPAARMKLDRTTVDAEIGGRPVRVEAELEATRADAARGRMSAKAPKGIEAKTPGRVVLQRGGRLTAAVEISVPKDTPSGEYTVPVGFTVDGRTVRQQVTVRAYPRTTGQDLALGAAATSSADETDDFPASAVSDGDPSTRWSSPAEDDSWVQVDLGREERIGRVVLRWQDAYASGYRIMTSADGRTWSTAAVVRDGRGGTEQIRMDAPGTRYLRVQGVERATKYGYSLFSVEAFPVAD